MDTFLINEVRYFPETPTILSFHREGVYVEGSFTGIVEFGGRNQETRYVIDGHDLPDYMGSAMTLDSLVKSALMGIAEQYKGASDSIPIPTFFEYTTDEDGAFVRKDHISNAVNLEWTQKIELID